MRRCTASFEMRRSASLLGALLLTNAVLACSSDPIAPETPGAAGAAGDAGERDGAAGGSTTTAPPVACDAFAELTCQSLAECSPLALKTDFGSLEVCEGRLTQLCTEIRASGLVLDTAACVEQVARPGCEAFRGAALPSACRAPVGAAKLDAACSADADCGAGSHCERKGSCGECRAWLRLGATCVSTSSCEPGLVCTEGACSAPSQRGESCSAASCGLHSECRDGKCEPLGQDGDGCDVTHACDGAAGFACRHGNCEVKALLDPGAGCRADGAEICSGASSCPATKLQPEAVCEALPSFGEECDVACAEPFECVDGACALPQALGCRP